MLKKRGNIMKKIIITVAFILIVIAMLFYFRTASQLKTNIETAIDKKIEPAPEVAQQQLSGSITSSSFNAGSTIPKEYTCDGRNNSPELSWYFNAPNISSSNNTDLVTNTNSATSKVTNNA